LNQTPDLSQMVLSYPWCRNCKAVFEDGVSWPWLGVRCLLSCSVTLPPQQGWGKKSTMKSLCVKIRTGRSPVTVTCKTNLTLGNYFYLLPI